MRQYPLATGLMKANAYGACVRKTGPRVEKSNTWWCPVCSQKLKKGWSDSGNLNINDKHDNWQHVPRSCIVQGPKVGTWRHKAVENREKTAAIARDASSSSGASSVPSVDEISPSLEKLSLQITEVTSMLTTATRMLTTISQQVQSLHGPVHQREG